MKKNTQKKTAGDYMRRGYVCEDLKRQEFYQTLLNDIAEDMEVKSRKHSRENLLEVIGYVRACEDRTNLQMSRLRTEVMLAATKSCYFDSEGSKWEFKTKEEKNP